MSKICAKVGPRLYTHYTWQLKRCGLKLEDLVTFYITVIRPVAEYGCTVWRFTSAWTATEVSSLRTILPDLSYSAALKASDLQTLASKRDSLSTQSFKTICDPEHKLNHLLPPKPLSATIPDPWTFCLCTVPCHQLYLVLGHFASVLPFSYYTWSFCPCVPSLSATIPGPWTFCPCVPCQLPWRPATSIQTPHRCLPTASAVLSPAAAWHCRGLQRETSCYYGCIDQWESTQGCVI